MMLRAYPDRDAWAEGAAAAIAADLGAALARGAGASLALPGGTTPAPILARLAQMPLDWARVTVFAADERCVPEGDARSNTGLLRAHLGQGPAAAARILSLALAPPTAEGVARLGAELGPHLPPAVLIAGMGADMHTASLFPDAPELGAALAPDAPPLMLLHPPGQPEARLSLSARMLSGAGAIHLAITGADKRAALDRAAGLAPQIAPVAAILPRATVHWSV
ncbi:MAG: hypothetical protein RLZ26_1269 [Pseudomonadota bacterium]|jgi:6-phosphogluconolactonase